MEISNQRINNLEPITGDNKNLAVTVPGFKQPNVTGCCFKRPGDSSPYRKNPATANTRLIDGLCSRRWNGIIFRVHLMLANILNPYRQKRTGSDVQGQITDFYPFCANLIKNLCSKMQPCCWSCHCAPFPGKNSLVA